MKRIVSLTLALVMVFGLAITASAAGTITGIIKPIDSNRTVDVTDIAPGKVCQYPLTADMFSWSDGSTGSNSTPVTRSQLNSGNITVRYSTSQEDVIDEISLVTISGQGYVQVKFISDFASVKAKDFKINLYLAVKSNRSSASQITLEGTISNPETAVATTKDYVDTSKGEVVAPTGYIRNLEFYTGEGVHIKTNVYGDRKYYAKASASIKASDDTILSRYPSIDTIINLSTVNISSSSKIVYFEDHAGYHVYNKDGKYLGVAPEAMELSTKYYLSPSKIDMTGSGSSSSSSSTPSSSSSGTTTASAGQVITADQARSLTQSAVTAARSSGSTTATVRVKDAASISASALQAMSSTASSSGMSAKLNADTMNGNSVSGRLTIKTASAANLSGDTQLGVYLDSSKTSSTKGKFEKWFSNKTVVVSLGQKSSYNMQVEVVAKADLSGLNTSNLVFYSYNTSTNQYTQISNPGSYIDSNGFLHFNTTLAGDIVITDKALTKK